MKKFCSILLSVLLLTAFLTSCTPPPAENSAEAPAASSPAAATAPESKGDKVTITLLQFKIDIADRVMKMAEDFNSSQSEINLAATVEGDEYNTLIKSRFAAGNAPDIFFTAGYSDIVRWKDNTVDLTNEPWADKIYDSAINGIAVDGKVYGMPIGFEGYGYIYNKKLFEKGGIDKLPTTVSELAAVCGKLQAAGIKSFSEAYQEFYTIGRLFDTANSMPPNARQFCFDVTAKKARLADNKFLNGMFDIIDLAVKYGDGVDSIGLDYDTEIANFSAEKNAMVFQGIWAEPSIKKTNPNIELGMFAIPFSDNSGETKLPVDVPACYAINSGSKNIDACKTFLNWLYENGQKYLVESFLLIPAFETMNITPEMGPLAQTIVDSVKAGTTVPWASFYRPEGDFYVILQEYVAGERTREQAIQGMQELWDKGA